MADTRVPDENTHNPEMFVAEYEDGSLLDNTGEGGWSCWWTRAEAQDAADQSDEPATVVRYVREPLGTHAQKEGTDDSRV